MDLDILVGVGIVLTIYLARDHRPKSLQDIKKLSRSEILVQAASCRSRHFLSTFSFIGLAIVLRMLKTLLSVNFDQGHPILHASDTAITIATYVAFLVIAWHGTKFNESYQWEAKGIELVESTPVTENNTIGALKKKDASPAITLSKVVLNPLRNNEAALSELEIMSLKEELHIFEQQTQLTLLRIPIPSKYQKHIIQDIVSQYDSLSYEIVDNQLLITKGNITHEAEVFVNIPQLATQGHDAFISYLRQDRMDSSGGQRSDMLWDVAETQNNNEDAFDAVHEGEGGVYAVSSLSGKKVAMFKPAEEEVFVREGLYAGEGAVREEAAYVIDSANGSFSGVPPTAVAQLYMANSKIAKPSPKANTSRFKLGAVQRFMNSRMGSMEDFGMPYSIEKASQFVSIEQVHRVGVLDIRLFNTDRHPGNLLLLGDSPPYSLVPIDHGCILPSWNHLSEARFDWISYPQTHEPFSEETMEYINHLNPAEDAHRLRRLGIREECITTLRICTMVLQEAAKAGKTLHWIGNFLQREGCFEEPSALENLISQACDACKLPYNWSKCDTGEVKFMVDQGILSRRPPDVFHDCLKHSLTKYLNA